MKMKTKQLFAATLTSIALSGCAVLHHVQVGDVDGNLDKAERFEVLVSETGINTQEAASIAKALTNDSKTKKDIQAVQDIISLFQMGPRTGNLVYDEHYADKVAREVVSRCPNGHVTGLMSVRETTKYPVVSGEIVKIVGYCIKKG